MSFPVSGLLLQHNCLASFLKYYYLSTCDLEMSFTFDSRV